MKKFISIIFAVIMAFSVSLFGCNSNEIKQTDAAEYTIMFNDGAATHTIKVKSGDLYEIEQPLPSKTGYDFMGLYDAEVGGVQYVSANGISLAPFTEKKNLVLFPQFKPKEYNIFLDYQGAIVTGNREYTVNYGERLPELPKNVELEHNEFVGWFTQENNQGLQVADKYGLLSSTSYVNETNFDLSGQFIYLYAGFETGKHTVTFCFEAGMDTEEVQVEYNTPISQVVPQTRVEGNAVYAWSKTQGGKAWNGKVTSDMVLYAVEYAPVIDFDCDGGNEVMPVVARAGDTIALPTPTKDLAKFSHWEDMSGNRFETTFMPAKSTTLKAVWQAKLVFDENGGTDVEDISVAAGTKITLPAPEKEGYIFAGWYNADKEKYTFSTMPAAGIALKAGWYTEKTANIVEIDSSSRHDDDNTLPEIDRLCYMFNFNNFFYENNPIRLKIDWHVKLAHSGTGIYTAGINIYSQKIVSTNYLIYANSFDNVISDQYKEFVFTTNFTVSDNFYICWFSNPHSDYLGLCISDFYYTVHYPDTTNLYL